METIKKLNTWDHSMGLGFFSVLIYVHIITITFVTGLREVLCSSSLTIRRSACVEDEREQRKPREQYAESWWVPVPGRRRDYINY